MHNVHQAWEEGLHVSALTFDLVGFFNNINKNALIEILICCGFLIQLVHWVKSFLSNHSAAIWINGKLGQQKPLKQGMPQGSLILPLLSALYTSDMPNFIKELNSSNKLKELRTHYGLSQIGLFIYIDDRKFFIASCSLTVNTDILECAFTKIMEWADHFCLDINTKKRNFVHYVKPRRCCQGILITFPSITLPSANGAPTTLKPKESIHWLGFFLDQGLTFHKHCKVVTAKAKSSLNLFHLVCKANKGLRQMHVQTIYLSSVCSIMVYGAQLWWNPKHHSMMKQLQLVQNQAMRMITRTFKTTPIDALHLLSHLPPIHLQLDQITQNAAIRLNTLPIDHPLIQYLRGEWLANTWL